MADKKLDSIVKIDGTDYNLTAEEAKTIQVTIINNDDVATQASAAVTVSAKEPTGGKVGDIWFKY